jgi:hypothetical protein
MLGTLLPEHLGIKRRFSKVRSLLYESFTGRFAAGLHGAMKVARACATHYFSTLRAAIFREIPGV